MEWDARFQIDHVGSAGSITYKDLHAEFNQGGDLEGWTSVSDISGLSAYGGNMSGTVIGQDPSIQSKALSFPAAEKDKWLVRLKNETNATTGRVYWTTDVSPSFSQSKSQAVSLAANDTKYREYFLNLEAHADWKDTITQLRLEPAENSSGGGSFSIDYMRLLDATYQHWEFSAEGGMQGWTSNQLTTSVSGGKLTGALTGTDPYLASATGLGINAERHQVIQIKMRNETNATKAKLYWKPSSEAFSENRTKVFTITPNDTTERIYTIRMDDESLWNGSIDRLRVDVAENSNGSGSVVIDYISLPIQE